MAVDAEVVGQSRAQLDRLEAKLNGLAKALGGPIVRREFAKAEKDLPKSRRTFKAAS